MSTDILTILKAPRIRFNWGYHAGADDATKRPGKGPRPAGTMNGVHATPKDRMYGKGYMRGYYDVGDGVYAGNSDAAWKARK